jgi:tripartite-type tricarboxylate transporter receptor subunit TctC
MGMGSPDKWNVGSIGRPAAAAGPRGGSPCGNVTQENQSMNRMRWLCAAAIGCASLAVCAQDFPTRPVHLIIAYGPGSGLDALTRATAHELASGWKQPVLVENRPGANGIIAAEACKRGGADGHTVCMFNRSFMVLPYLLTAKMPVDPAKDFKPVTKLLNLTQVIVAHPSVGAGSMKELVAVARAKPGVLNYASLGPGSGLHLLFDWIKRQYGVDIVHVPYKNPVDLVQSVVTGQTSVSMFGSLNFLGQIRAGKVRVLAVSERIPQLPGVPTLAEQGFNFDVSNWFGYFVPAGTPDPVIRTLRDEVARIYAIPAFREKFLVEQALLPVASTPEEFARSLPADTAASAEAIKASGARID